MISLIAAVAQNNVIGLNNSLPWDIPRDTKFFKDKTLNHTVILGRKTFESLKEPLNDRKTIVITHQENYAVSDKNVFIVKNINEALDLCKDDDEVMIAGGQEIYKQTINIADRLYITHIQEEIHGDAFFPDIDLQNWKLIKKETFFENDIEFSFCVYQRKS